MDVYQITFLNSSTVVKWYGDATNPASDDVLDSSIKSPNAPHPDFEKAVAKLVPHGLVAGDLKKGTYFVKELKISESDKGLSFTMTLRKELPGNKKALISLPTIEVKNSIIEVMDEVLEEAALYVGGKQSQLGIEFPKETEGSEGEGGPAEVEPTDPVFLSKGAPKRVRTEKMAVV